MKRSTRILILAAVAEAGLFALMVYLIAQTKSGAMATAMPVPEAISRIATGLGAAMGVFLAVCILTFLALRKKGD
jgi:hypothetical protein